MSMLRYTAWSIWKCAKVTAAPSYAIAFSVLTMLFLGLHIVRGDLWMAAVWAVPSAIWLAVWGVCGKQWARLLMAAYGLLCARMKLELMRATGHHEMIIRRDGKRIPTDVYMTWMPTFNSYFAWAAGRQAETRRSRDGLSLILEVINAARVEEERDAVLRQA